MSKKIEVCHEFTNKLPHFLSRNDRSFLSYIVDTEKFSVKIFYEKKRFDNIDVYVDEFLEELKKSNLSKHGWLTEDCLIAEIGGGPLDNTTFFIRWLLLQFYNSSC